MNRSIRSVMLMLSVIVVLCLGVPLALWPTLRGHVMLSLDTPFSIYVVCVMPVLVSVAAVLFMARTRRTALWIPLAVEICLLVLLAMLDHALAAILQYPLPSALMYFGFVSTPALIVLFIQLLTLVFVKKQI